MANGDQRKNQELENEQKITQPEKQKENKLT